MATYTFRDGSEAIEITTDDNCFETNRVFPGWFGDAKDGEEYLSEWACYAADAGGQRYMVVWQFPAIKGEEVADDEWPWDDESFVDHIDAI